MRFMITKIRRTGAGLVALVAIGCVQNRHAQVEKTPIASEQGGWIRKFPYLTSNTSRHSVFDDPSQWPAKPPESVVQTRFSQMFPNLSRRTSNRTFDRQTTFAAVATDTTREVATSSTGTESVNTEAIPAVTDAVAESQVRTVAGNSDSSAAIEPAARSLTKSEWANLSASSAGVAAVVAALAATSDAIEPSDASPASLSNEPAVPNPSQNEPHRTDDVQIASRPVTDRTEGGRERAEESEKVVQPPVSTSADPKSIAENDIVAAPSEMTAANSPAPAQPTAETRLAKSPQPEPAVESVPKAPIEAASNSTNRAGVTDPGVPATPAAEIPAIPATVASSANAIPANPVNAQKTPDFESVKAPGIPAVPAPAAPAVVTSPEPVPNVPPMPPAVVNATVDPAPEIAVNPAPEVPPIPAVASSVASVVPPATISEIPAIPQASTAVQPKLAPENPVTGSSVASKRVNAAPAIPATEVPPIPVTNSPIVTAEPTKAPEIPAIPAQAPQAPAAPAIADSEIPSIPAVPASPAADGSTVTQATEPVAAQTPVEPVVAASTNRPPSTTESPSPLPAETVVPQSNLTIPAVPEVRDASPASSSNEPTPVVPGIARNEGSRSGERPEWQVTPETPPAPPAPAELPGVLNEPPLPPPAPEVKIPGIGETASETEIPANPTDVASPTDSGIEKSSGSLHPMETRPESAAAQVPANAETAVPVANPETDAPKLELAPGSNQGDETEIPVLHPLPDDETAANGESEGSVLERKPGEIVIHLRLKNPLSLSRFRPAQGLSDVSEKPRRSLKSAAKSLFAWQRRGRTTAEAEGESATTTETDIAEKAAERSNSPLDAGAVQAVQTEVAPAQSNDEMTTQTAHAPVAESTTNSADQPEEVQTATAPATDAQSSVAEASKGDDVPAASPSNGSAYFIPGRSPTDSLKVLSANGLPPVEFPSSYHAARPRSANPWSGHSKPAVNLVSDPRSGLAPVPAVNPQPPAAAETVPVTRREAWPKMKPDLEVVRTSLNVVAPKVVESRASEPVEPQVRQPGPSWWSKSSKGVRSFFFGEEEVVPAKRPNWAKQQSTLR